MLGLRAWSDYNSTNGNYSQQETSEIFIGEWMEKRGLRDQLVIATKVGACLLSLVWSGGC